MHGHALDVCSRVAEVEEVMAIAVGTAVTACTAAPGGKRLSTSLPRYSSPFAGNAIWSALARCSDCRCRGVQRASFWTVQRALSLP